ncbi:MAG: LemA family protein [Candidatus Nanoarchaeia archaeon]
MVWTWIGIGVVVVIGLWILLTYNAFVRLKNQVENAWSQIDVQLKRRTDLIPNLINTVKGYAKHERETLDSVTEARSQLMSAQERGDTKQMAESDNMLTDALKSLFAVSEAYPDLKANTNFLQLQEELSGTENKISAARQYFNDMVMSFNTKLQSFPASIIGNMFGFKEKEFFEIPEEQKEVPNVEF